MLKSAMRITIISIIGSLFLFIGYVIFDNINNVTTVIVKGFNWAASQETFVAGGITLWVLGVSTYLLRIIPAVVWDIIVKQATVTLILNNEDDVYSHFLQWYHQTGRSKTSRTLVASNQFLSYENEETPPTDDTVCEGTYTSQHRLMMLHVSAGYGTHYFWFNGRLFQFVRREKEAGMTKDVKESLSLKTIGRSQLEFHKLLTEITPVSTTANVTRIYKWSSDNYWAKYGTQASRKLESVILPDGVRETIVSHIDNFNSRRTWYIENGIPYRTGIMLHGLPGTGKTSLVKGLCDHFNKSLYVINLSVMTDESLQNALNTAPRNSVILMEDIDTYSVTNSREEKSSSSMGDADLGILTLSGLLNAIDGILGSDGRIIVATTNHIERLDLALVRKGRFNLSIELGYLTQDCVQTFITRFYPTVDVSTMMVRKDILPVDLQAEIMDHVDNSDHIIKWITKQ